MSLLTAEPVIVERPAQPYVGVRGLVTMDTFRTLADRLPGVLAWLSERGLAPAGAPFFKYNVIDMERELEVEGGVPVDELPELDGDRIGGVLPAGRFLTATYVGNPANLIDVTSEFLAFADEHGLTWDAHESERGRHWGCRLELLKSDPREIPSWDHFETELAFRLGD